MIRNTHISLSIYIYIYMHIISNYMKMYVLYEMCVMYVLTASWMRSERDKEDQR